MKRLTPDPWLEAAKNFKIGKTVEGEINKVTQFGAFVKLGEDINGLIHLTEIQEEPLEDATEALKAGDKVKAKIISVDPEEHRIGLSIKALSEKGSVKKEEKDEAKAEDSAENSEKEEETAEEEIAA